LLFESLKENLEYRKSIYQFKPDKFNEICSLDETQLNQELAYKEQLLKLSNVKDIERTESLESLKDIGLANYNNQNNLEASKKFGSLDSLSAALGPDTANNSISTLDTSVGNCFSNIKNIRVPLNKKYSIWISFYELYNDNVYDLLTLPNKNTRNNERTPLKIREDSNRIPYVEGLVYIPVSNTRDAIKILKYGEKNLQKSSNSINTSSSRSHAVFCLKIVSFESNKICNQSTVSINQLSFCDLAGIERLSKTNAVGKTHKESSHINTSLLSLSRCINAMIANQKSKSVNAQVPYRSNKLTRLFQAYFEGRGMVKMIVNVNPAISCFDESVGVLKFASIANQVTILRIIF
jgi:kinesin family protein 20